jgi:hypothetical protein
MTAVTIPNCLIKRLQALGPHFCMVYSEQQKHPDPREDWKKRPVGNDWQHRLMFADDPKLQEWLAKGGNYGVVGGYGLVIADADIPEVKQILEEQLPETFTVESPGSHGWHAYFLCGLEKPIRLRDKNGENVGDIQGPNKMVLGPNSIHPNGEKYRIAKDLPLAQVTAQQLREALKEWIVPEKEIQQAEFAANQEKRNNIDLDILQVIPLAGLHKRGSEYFGPHPIHGSTTKQNFWVNPSKNCWHCFRHGSGGGPLLWLAVEEGIIDCSEAGSGALRGETFKQTWEKAQERGYIQDRQAKEKKPLVLDHINKIEDPNLAGIPVTVEAVVSSTSIAYLIPKQVEVDYKDKDGNMQHLEREFDAKDPMNVKLVGVNEGTKQRRLNSRLRTGKEYVKDLAHRSVYRIRVRPPVFTLEKRGEKIVDEKGFEYKAHDLYITSDRNVSFQPSSLICIEGLTLPNPRTQKTTLLVYKTEFPEEIRAYDIENLQRLKAKFGKKTVKQRLDWILDNFEIYSQIIDRRNLAQAGFLVYFTPTWVRFNGDLQRGWGNGLSIGDTTVGKSETQRKMISLLNAGMLITAETASTVGLTGTATQIEREGWFVDWGFLVLLDRKLLAIDGAHKLSGSNWACLAEAERSGVVNIAKAAKNSAYARTRQMKIANAVDIESNKYSTKSLANFLYPCQALTTILDKTSIARLDLAVFADQRDVSAKRINKKHDGEYDRDLHLLSEALRWCWSGTAKIDFTAKAVNVLLEKATTLHSIYFCEMIPLVSIDMKWKLARLSVALAYLTLSTDTFETVKVTEDHVRAIVEFLENEYSRIGLNTLAQEQKFEVLDSKDVKFIINSIITQTEAALDEPKIKNVLKFIVLQGRVTRDQLMTKFGLSEKNQLRPLLAVLSNEKMIRSGRGLYPTPKLVEAYKILNVAKVTKDTNLPEEPLKNSGEKNNKIGGSFSDLGKLGNLGKKPQCKHRKDVDESHFDCLYDGATYLKESHVCGPDCDGYKEASS